MEEINAEGGFDFRSVGGCFLVRLILALVNHKNACFSMPLQCLPFGFNWENRIELCCFVSKPHCKVVASTLSTLILPLFNIAEIMGPTYFGAF